MRGISGCWVQSVRNAPHLPVHLGSAGVQHFPGPSRASTVCPWLCNISAHSHPLPLGVLLAELQAPASHPPKVEK